MPKKNKKPRKATGKRTWELHFIWDGKPAVYPLSEKPNGVVGNIAEVPFTDENPDLSKYPDLWTIFMSEDCAKCQSHARWCACLYADEETAVWANKFYAEECGDNGQGGIVCPVMVREVRR